MIGPHPSSFLHGHGHVISMTFPVSTFSTEAPGRAISLLSGDQANS